MPADETKAAAAPEFALIAVSEADAMSLIAQLDAALRKALVTFENQSLTDGERRAVTALLFEMSAAVMRLWPGDEHRPLLRLARALASLETGAVDPLFAPVPTGGRPRALGLESQKGHIAGTIDLYMRCGQGKLEAARSVSKILRRRGVTIKPETLLGWRKEASETAGLRHDAYEMVRQGALVGETPAALEAIESMLARAARDLRPRK